jgi:large subunit ribosomal protein L13Ae
MNISGSLQRNVLLHSHTVRKRMNTNHRRGPFHFNAPSRFLFFAIRGMIPYKTTRGKMAMNRMRIYEGCPSKFQNVKKLVIPGALTVLRLKPGRKYCRLGDLSQKYGWSYGGVVAKLEAKRKVAGAAFYKLKLAKARKVASNVAAKSEQLKAINEQLAKYGY